MVLVFINPAMKFSLTLYPVVLDMEIWIFSRFPRRPVITEEESASLYASEEATPLLHGAIQRPASYWKEFQYAVLYGDAVKRVLFRTMVCGLVLLTAILLPQFDKVISLLGSLFSVTSSILFPFMVYLAFDRSAKDLGVVDGVAPWSPQHVMIPTWQRVLLVVGIIFYAILGIIGTIWTVLPQHLL